MFNTLRTDLRISTAEGTATNVMVGIGETYLPAFVLALTGSQLACGLVSTLPLLVGAVLQLASPRLLRSCGSYRRWVVLCAALQAATFVPLLAAALAGRMSVVAVFALVSVYWATGLAANGPWNAWIETLVPAPLRIHYFAWRSRINQWGIVAGFLAGGIALQTADRLGIPLAVFAVLFFLAAASRFVSVGLLTMHREPQPPRRAAAAPLADIFRGLRAGENGRLLLYLMAVQAAVQIAGPYFNPFMLGELHFSYTIYAVVICAATVAKVYFLPTVGRIADRLGVRRVFWASAVGSIFVPLLWLASHNWVYLVVVQVYSGMVWCASTWRRCCCSSRRSRGKSGSTCSPSSTWRTPRPWPAARSWARASSPRWAAIARPTWRCSRFRRWAGQWQCLCWPVSGIAAWSAKSPIWRRRRTSCENRCPACRRRPASHGAGKT